jgi:hypothetical protein
MTPDKLLSDLSVVKSSFATAFSMRFPQRLLNQFLQFSQIIVRIIE